MPKDLRSLQFPKDFHPFALNSLETSINGIQNQELKKQLLGELFSLGQTIEHIDLEFTSKVQQCLLELNFCVSKVREELAATLATNEMLIAKTVDVLNRSLEEENLENKNLLVTKSISALQRAKDDREEIAQNIINKLFSDLENIFRNHLR